MPATRMPPLMTGLSLSPYDLEGMKGSPAGLFPVGEEGGRLRSLNEALKVGVITGDFPIRFCRKCGKKMKKEGGNI